MPVELGGVPCLSPRALVRDCVQSGVAAEWGALANSYSCSVGTRPGTGWVLLALSDLLTLDPALEFAQTYTLSFASATADASADARVDLPGMEVVGADCVTPGRRGDEAAYLVRLADRRLHLGRLPLDRAFNCRHVYHGAYFDHTLRPPRSAMESIRPYTWDEALAEAWAPAGPLFGPWPGLPPRPDARRPPPGSGAEVLPENVPEGLEYYQTTVADAVEDLLSRVGCVLTYDPVRAIFGVARRGLPDPRAAAALASRDRLRVWDGYPLRGARASVPDAVRVLFRKLPHVRNAESPWLTLDRRDPTRAGAGAVPPGVTVPGTFTLLEDDEPALFDAAGRLVNGAALEVRADQRAADHFRQLHSLTRRARLVYDRPLGDAGLMPGPQIEEILWRETAAEESPYGGCVTEVRRAGEPPRPPRPDTTLDPLTEVVLVRERTGSTPEGLLPGVVQRWEAGVWVPQRDVWVVDGNAGGPP